MTFEPNAMRAELWKRSDDLALALSFWSGFVKEVRSLAKVLQDRDDSPYLELSESQIERIGRWPERAQWLRIGCEGFEFTAIVEPLSIALVYELTTSGIAAVFKRDLQPARRGVVAVSLEGSSYRVEATPEIKELQLSSIECDGDDFGNWAIKLARWACATLVLTRLQALRVVAAEAQK